MEFYNVKRHTVPTTIKHLINQRNYSIKEKRTVVSKAHGSKVVTVFSFAIRFLIFCKKNVQYTKTEKACIYR